MLWYLNKVTIILKIVPLYFKCVCMCMCVLYIKIYKLERYSSVIPHSTSFLIKKHEKTQLKYFYLKRNCKNQGSYIKQTNMFVIIFLVKASNNKLPKVGIFLNIINIFSIHTCFHNLSLLDS